MSKNTGCLKLLKDGNPNMLVVHCVIHRENLVQKILLLNYTKYYILRSNASIISKAFRSITTSRMPYYLTLLMTTDGKMLLLADIFEKLCSLNKQLQGADATLCDAKAKIFGFVTFISLCKDNIMSKCYVQFPWLKKCEITRRTQLLLNT